MMVTQNHAGFQFDFRGDMYSAGRAIEHGVTPYLQPVLNAEATIVRHGSSFGPRSSPRWPMPTLVAALPLSVLPFKLAGWIFMSLCLGGFIGALRLLGVRDWRCMVVACLSWPVMWGIWLGNISPLLVLAAALVWRWRSRARLLGVAVAAAVLAKLILWTLAVWLVMTRRSRALPIAVAVGTIACTVAWSLIGLRTLGQYPHLLSTVQYIGEGRGSSLTTLLISIGAPAEVARRVALFAASLTLFFAWRMYRTPDGDRRAFGLCIMAALIATPVVWAHYYALLFVPIALLSPRLSWLWFVPMLAVLNPAPTAHPSILANLSLLVMRWLIVMQLCSPWWRGKGAALWQALRRRSPGMARNSYAPG
jgi:alpha-1,2-mannosyltransferase